IVATIQKEQNEIIRKSPYHNCLVQGVAGSGKTTVAMHRISYILYNYAERFRPEDFYIVGSNRILLNYITGVLPDLDVYGVRQMTMEQLFVRLLYEDWDEKKYSIKSTDTAGKKNIVKGRLSWFRELEKFCNELEWNTILRESIYLNPKQFVEGFVDGKPGVHDRTGGKPVNPRDLVLLMDGSSVESYIRQNPTISIQSKIDMLNERLRTKILNEFLSKGIKYTEAERKAILKAYQGRYGGNVWKKSIFVMYEEFLKVQMAKGHDVDVPDTAFDVYDLAALAYLYKRVKETEVISEAHHIVIDEAQDFGMMAYSVLKFCIKDCTYTIMGDVSQNIHFGYGLNDWEELKELYLKDSRASFGILKKSYRNTVEISDFATRILHHGRFASYPVEPIIRHGNAPQVAAVKNRGELMKKAAEICREWQQKGLGTIAVICRNTESARKTAGELGQLVEVMESNLETAEFGNGIMVLPVEFTKGLEFDAVLILDPTREEYPVDDGHAKLLYVAATRALHELCVLHTGDLTGLIADPVPEGAAKVIEDVPKQGIKVRKKVQGTAGTKSESGDRDKEKRLEVGSETAQAKAENEVKLPETRTRPRPKENAVEIRRAEIGIAKGKEKSVILPEVAREKPENPFGSMPSTELLRPAGHAKTDQAVRWVTKQTDGLYLHSSYGVLRLSPIAGKIIRVTFAKGSQLPGTTHPNISVGGPFREWMYRESGKLLEMKTSDIYLQVDKGTGTIQYMTRDKQPLLAERSRESRLLEKTPQGVPRARLYLDWPKKEKLNALGAGTKAELSLTGAARYISHIGRVDKLPMVISDKGYALLVAADGPVFCCDIPTYGNHLCVENAELLDYYFIIGKDTSEFVSTYNWLCGKR
ncbi:MAG: AAA family ATPase, partial [Roseburia sp.]|nr:AAA family ATPase [Roseburia sp.]